VLVQSSHFRPEMTFDRFVPTRSTKTALRVCNAIASEDSRSPSLSVLHGPTGTGKTHLLMAIANAVTSRSNIHMAYVAAADLLEDFVRATRTDTRNEFDRTYVDFDLILVDHLQALVGKPRTESALASRFAAWTTQGTRIIGAVTYPYFSKQTPLLLSTAKDAHHVPIPCSTVIESRLITKSLARDRGLSIARRSTTAIAQACAGDVRRIVGMLTEIAMVRSQHERAS
jgi:chromosomal replication initiator protein